MYKKVMYFIDLHVLFQSLLGHGGVNQFYYMYEFSITLIYIYIYIYSTRQCTYIRDHVSQDCVGNSILDTRKYSLCFCKNTLRTCKKNLLINLN